MGTCNVPILYGAVAYLEDCLHQFEDEIASWDLARVYQHPIACPACDKTYRILHEVTDSDETIDDYVDTVLQSMERQACENHAPRIRIKLG